MVKNIRRWQVLKIAAWIGRAIMVAGVLAAIFSYPEWKPVLLTAFLLSYTVPLFIAHQTPKLIDLMIVFAALINTGVWILNGSEEFFLLDEVTHLYTAFSATFFIGFLMLKRSKTLFTSYPFFSLISLVSLGITIGVLWEIYEWTAWYFFPGYEIDPLTDAITDLILDGIGAIIAAALVKLLHQQSH